jgi:hypothetical protein
VNRVKFHELAATLGVSVEYLPGGTVRGERRAAEFMVDAPQGKVFTTSGCHCDGSLSHSVEEDGTRTNWTRAANGLREIAASVQDCPDGPGCDICHPDEEPE